MSGNQSRGLILSAKTRGWDPTVIPDSPGTLANFDKDQGNAPGLGAGLGTLPEGIHDTYPDGYDIPAINPGAEVPWTTPDYSREMKDRRTVGADTLNGQGNGGRQ